MKLMSTSKKYLSINWKMITVVCVIFVFHYRKKVPFLTVYQIISSKSNVGSLFIC